MTNNAELKMKVLKETPMQIILFKNKSETVQLIQVF